MSLGQDFSNIVGALPEDERPVVEGLPLRAATLPALARLMAQAFDASGELRGPCLALPRTLLFMHQWFVPSAALAQQLVALHRGASHSESCVLEDCSHQRAPCPQQLLREQVCHAFRYWILSFPMHWSNGGDTEQGLASILYQFQSTLSGIEAERLDLSQVPSYDWMRNVSVRTGLGTAVRKISLVFNNLQPLQLAEHLTFLEHKVLRRIAFSEVKHYVHTGSLSKAPKLERSVALCNGLTQWVQCMVLSRTTPAQRAHMMDKFIAVAQKLLELQNFNCLMAVVGSVSHSVLARLSRTMQLLPSDSKQTLAELTELLSSTGNFSNYRKSLQACDGFRIPILAIHLKDLVSLNVAIPDTLEGEMINVRKMAQLSLIFEELEHLRHTQPPFEVNMDLVNTLRLSLDLAYTEEEIYELSLAREPRNATSPQTSPTQPVLFAEWAAGPCTPPDPQIIEKHVTAMVDAVFKTYDNDRDGYISHEEFDAVAGNFPFIASFCVLDADHDGMISQEEMKKYFIHANCHALKSGFKHEFHETTYFKPTFCAHCAGLLWGLIRQGYKCRDCGINAHKHCKELVVMECRLRPNPATGDTSSQATNSRRRFRRKKKSSMSESESSPPSPKYSTTGDSEHSDGGGGGGSLPPSPKPASLWGGPRRKISDSLLVPAHTRSSAPRLRPQQSCPESSNTRNRPPLSHQAAVLHPPCTMSEQGPRQPLPTGSSPNPHPKTVPSQHQASSIQQTVTSEACPPHQTDVHDSPIHNSTSLFHHSSFPHLSPGYQECLNQMSAVHKAISQLFQHQTASGKQKCASQPSLVQENNLSSLHLRKDMTSQASASQCNIEQLHKNTQANPHKTTSNASLITFPEDSLRDQATYFTAGPSQVTPNFRPGSQSESPSRQGTTKTSPQMHYSPKTVPMIPEHPATLRKHPLERHSHMFQSLPANTSSSQSDTSPTHRGNLHRQGSTVHQSLAHSCKELEEAQQKLQAAEEARQRLERENHFLLQQLEAAYCELDSLREHVGDVRQHTVAFILSQMETLHLQKDTHV